MKSKSSLLVILSLLSAISVLALYVPATFTIPAVHAGEPAGDATFRTLCIGLLPATPNCVDPSLAPFESLVYDTNANNQYDSGEIVIVGPTPTVGTALVDDSKIKFRDTIGGLGNWDAGETIFYDATGVPSARITLIGVPSISATLVKDDPKILFADGNTNGVLDGVVKVTVRLEKLGGTNIDSSREEVDALQAIYSYNPAVLSAMRQAYPSGVPMLGATYSTIVRTHCSNSGLSLDADGKTLINGGSPSDAVSIDDVAGKFQSSELCSQGPPRTPEVGLGCDPATAGSDVDVNSSPWYFCPGADGLPRTLDGVAQNLDLISSQYLILGRALFTLECLSDSPGNPGCKMVDIDGSTATPMPVTAANADFDNRLQISPPVITANCPNGTTGKAITCTSDATGGTQPYTFTWDAPDGTPTTGTGTSFNTIFAVKGPHTVTAKVEDANHQTDSKDITVTIQSQPIIITAACSDGTAGKPISCTASTTGGHEPIALAWTAIGGTPASGAGPSFSTTYAVKGTYTVTVTATDANNVAAHQDLTVHIASQPLVLTASCDPSGTAGKPVSCTASTTGGHEPVVISWTAADGTPGTGSGGTFQTSFAVKGQHTISVKATDANDVATDPQIFTVTIASQPLVLTVDCPASGSVGSPVTCTATTTGGHEPITISWTATGGSPSSGTGPSFTTMYSATGTFDIAVHATDVNDVSTATQTFHVEITTLSVNGTCSDGTAGRPVNCSATTSGGTPPVTISWTAIDGTPNSGTGNTFQTTFAVKGSHTVTVEATDNNGVMAFQDITVTVASQPLVLTASCGGSGTVGKAVSCTASTTGGHEPVVISWTAADGTPGTGSGGTFQTSFAVKGQHTISVKATDANDVATDPQIFTVNIASQPIVITATCEDGIIGQPINCTASASGGHQPLSDFSWSAPGGTPSTGTGPTFQTTYSTIGQHTITVTVTDANSVTASKDVQVQIGTVAIVLNATCDTSGTAGKQVSCSATASGGQEPLTISWSAVDGTPSTGTGGSFSTTFAVKGSYTITATATDANGASTHRDLSVSISSQPLVLTASCDASGTVAKPVSCSASTTGGHEPVTINWSAPGGSPSSGSGASFQTSYAAKGPHTITVTATDANNVSSEPQSFPVSIAGQPLTVDMTFPTPVFAGRPVTFTSVVSGGSIPYTYAWDLGKNGTIDSTDPTFTLTFSNPTTLSVDLVVTDANGASARVNKNIEVLPAVVKQPLVLTEFSVSPSNVFVTESRLYTATYTGGTGPFTCTFDFGDGSAPLAVTVNTQFCTATHTYAIVGSFTADVQVVGQNAGDDVSGSLHVTVQPEPTFARGKLSWRHHLLGPGPQTFTGKAVNPSSIEVLVRVDMQVDQPDGLQDTFTSPSFKLTAGQLRTDMSFTYSPKDGLGKYCFNASLKYGADMNNDGILQDSELLGTDKVKTGCFNLV